MQLSWERPSRSAAVCSGRRAQLVVSGMLLTTMIWQFSAMFWLWSGTDCDARGPRISEAKPPRLNYPSRTITRDTSGMQQLRPPEDLLFSVIINTYRRVDLLKDALLYYRSCPFVDTIHVVWCEAEEPPDSDNMQHPSWTPIVFHVMNNCSLNNRFMPLEGLHSEAVFSVDDDIRLPCDDLYKAYQVWRQHPDTLVGFYPRLHLWQARSCRHKYLRTFDTLLWHKEYSIVLTKAAFLHRDYLQHYTYGIPSEVRRYVDRNRNCEDLAMQFAVAAITGLPPIAVHSARKRDLGAGLAKQVQGISSSRGHDERRSMCLDDLTELFGGSMLLTSRPVKDDPEGWKMQLAHVFGSLLTVS